jgi:GNAT superfamily N-acetyltransferase
VVAGRHPPRWPPGGGADHASPDLALNKALIEALQRSGQAVWALHQLASHIAGVPTSGAYFSDLQQIESTFLDRAGEFIVGEYAGPLVAMGGLKRTSADRAEITRMRVHPAYQRRGFGTAVLRHLEKRAAELGYSTLHLDTLVEQETAQQFYLQQGYRCVGRGERGKIAVVFFESG